VVDAQQQPLLELLDGFAKVIFAMIGEIYQMVPILHDQSPNVRQLASTILIVTSLHGSRAGRNATSRKILVLLENAAPLVILVTSLSVN
jgi:hypothetical protein